MLLLRSNSLQIHQKVSLALKGKREILFILNIENLPMSMSTWSERSAESGTVGQWNLVVVTGDVVLWHGTLTGASHWLRASLKEVVA